MSKIQNVSIHEVQPASGKRTSSDPSKDVTALVLEGDDLKEVMNNIISKMKTVVSRTMGPYGKNAIIQRMNDVNITKDGYLTARALNIGNNIAERSLCNICMDTIASTNITAGDGTSGTIVVAAGLHKRIQDYLGVHFMTVRDLETTINRATEIIQNQVLDDAIQITDGNMKDAIFKIANVSTNWDTYLASIIANIYTSTNNPVIKKVNSGTTETWEEIVDGYDLAGHLLLQDMYITNFEKGTREVDKPFILVFDSTLPDSVLDAMIGLVSYANVNGIPEIIIMAKGFTTSLVNRVAAINGRAAKTGMKPIGIIMAEYHAPSAIDRECVLDFCDLIGAEVISGDSKIRSQIDTLGKQLRAFEESVGTAKTEQAGTIQDMIRDTFNELAEVAGACEHLSIGNKSVVASGLWEDNGIIEKKKAKLKKEIDEALRDATAKTMVTDSIAHKQIRLGKLNCRMGIIHVGGRGSAHLKSRNDAVDDAIRACQLAYTSGGYTIGGCYAIPHAWESLCADGYRGLKEVLTGKDDFDEIVAFGSMICMSFVDVIQTVMRNKYGAPKPNTPVNIKTTHSDIIAKYSKLGVAYNIITEKPDRELIEPVMVDIAILNSALSLVMTLETTDQYLYTAYENIG